MSLALSDAEIQSVVSEAQYLLKRWRFAASAAGFLWIQPVGPRLSPEELAGFITLLKRGCGAAGSPGFPRVIVFDFSEVDVVGGQWTMIEALLSELARSIGARLRISSSHKRPASAIMLYRGEPERTAPVPPAA
jgi:hypothetical protein